MNHIEQIFERCNMETISEFLIHGGELLEKTTTDIMNGHKKQIKNKRMVR